MFFTAVPRAEPTQADGSRSVTGYAAAFRSAYDYYPFGMLMPGRYISDTSSHCITISQPRWEWKWVTIACWDVYDWVWYYHEEQEGMAQIKDDVLEIEAKEAADGVSFGADVLAGQQQMLQIDLQRVAYAGEHAMVQVTEQVNGRWVRLATQPVKAGMRRMKLSFTPTTNFVRIEWWGPVRVYLFTICLKGMDWVQEDALVTICDGDKDKYRFGYNGKEKINEWSGVGNYLDFGARGLDTRIGRWLTVDPLASKYPSWSPYAFCYNNPINFVDPDGRSGEPVIDKKNKTVTIFSKLYFYGSGANTKLSNKIATGIAYQWNNANATTTIDGVEYEVNFRISYETVTTAEAKEIAKNNTSLKNNFVRVEDGKNGKSSFTLADDKGGNSFWFNTDDELGSSTTPAHEYGHGLGLSHPKEDYSNSTDRPHIMIPRGTPYGDSYSIDNNGNTTVNPNSRRVTPENVSNALQNDGGSIHNIIINEDGTH